MSKRTLDHFFSPKAKKSRPEDQPSSLYELPKTTKEETVLALTIAATDDKPPVAVEIATTITEASSLPTPSSPSTSSSTPSISTHQTYPWPIPHLPPNLTTFLTTELPPESKTINNRPDLDLLYLHPLFPRLTIASELFKFLRENLFFYRVEYTIKRGPLETKIHTPRFTTVFGLDETSRFNEDGTPIDAFSQKLVPERYKKECKPRPLPQCLDTLRSYVEMVTGATFNFCLVNYYATGEDSISYHSDDEHFLGPLPTIASLSLGGTRDFLMKHKDTQYRDEKPLKMALESGDMVVMRGKTQSRWLHSIPKRKGKSGPSGRINITFRKAVVKGGTENYYNYNVGNGPPFKWSSSEKQMVLYTR